MGDSTKTALLYHIFFLKSNKLVSTLGVCDYDCDYSDYPEE